MPKMMMPKAVLLKKLQAAQAKARADAKAERTKENENYKARVKRVAAIIAAAGKKLAETGEVDRYDFDFPSVHKPENDGKDINATIFDAAIDFLNAVTDETIEFDVAREKDPFGLLRLFNIASGGKRY